MSERLAGEGDSYWAATTRHACSFPALESNLETDVVIVGGGFTGLSAARHVHNAGLRCALLEASTIGAGASGRNGGIAVPRYKLTYPELEKAFGTDVAQLMYRLAHRAVSLLAATVKDERLDVGFSVSGHLTPIEKDFNVRRFEADVDWLRTQLGDTQPVLLDREETRRHVGSAFYRAAYLEPRGAVLHPLEYCQALANRLSERGVPIFCASAARSWKSTADGLVVEAGRAKVFAKRLILATNAYTDLTPIGGSLKRRIVPVASALVATVPLDPELRGTILPSGRAATDAKRLTNYYRLMPDGCFVFGGRGGAFRSASGGVYERLLDGLARIYPALQGTSWSRRWYGLVAVTMDNLPRLGTLSPRVAYALGYSGRGVALSALLGEALGQWALGESPDLGPITSAPFEPIPFHSLRLPGKHAVMTYYRLLDALGL